MGELSFMKDFNELSGPWTGLSVQDGLRISEQIHLRIHAGQIGGSGSDKDGDFELVGFYRAKDARVTLTRRYERTNLPNNEGAGIPYDYEGHWDGAMVSGRWHPRWDPSYGGEFEMWPNREEDREELAIHLERSPLKLSSG